MVLYKLFILRIRVPITSVSCSIVDDKAYFILQFSNLRNDNHRITNQLLYFNFSTNPIKFS